MNNQIIFLALGWGFITSNEWLMQTVAQNRNKTKIEILLRIEVCFASQIIFYAMKIQSQMIG